MKSSAELVVFAVDEQRVALALPCVQRVVRAVEISPLPQGPSAVLGVINCHGEIIPVFNMRGRLHLPERELEANDQFIIARTARRTVVLVADEVLGVQECAEAAVTAAAEILPGLEGLDGVLRCDDGMILIHNLDKFLSLDEEQVLEMALRTQGAAP